MKNFLLSAVAAVAVAISAPALAQAAPTATPSTPAAHHMRMMKPITRAAFQQRVQKLFARLDTNHDGFVTQDEVQASAEAMHARMATATAQRGSKLFDRLDANHDGVVTQAEFNAALANRAAPAGSHRPAPTWERFAARFDANHDGQVTRAEIDAVRAQHGQQVAENGKPNLHRAGFAQQMFAMADLNHDGRVSLQEANQAALQHFDAADTNHDGILSPDEMRAMHQRMRPQARRP
jgi:Ca2+-binding EF-hand superfamily protein